MILTIAGAIHDVGVRLDPSDVGIIGRQGRDRHRGSVVGDRQVVRCGDAVDRGDRRLLLLLEGSSGARHAADASSSSIGSVRRFGQAEEVSDVESTGSTATSPSTTHLRRQLHIKVPVAKDARTQTQKLMRVI